MTPLVLIRLPINLDGVLIVVLRLHPTLVPIDLTAALGIIWGIDLGIGSHFLDWAFLDNIHIALR